MRDHEERFDTAAPVHEGSSWLERLADAAGDFELLSAELAAELGL